MLTMQDLELIDDRKFVIRYFFVATWYGDAQNAQATGSVFQSRRSEVHNNRIYLHECGVVIVHGARSPFFKRECAHV